MGSESVTMHDQLAYTRHHRLHDDQVYARFQFAITTRLCPNSSLLTFNTTVPMQFQFQDVQWGCFATSPARGHKEAQDGCIWYKTQQR